MDREALRGVALQRVETCRSLADGIERFHTADVGKRTRQPIRFLLKTISVKVALQVSVFAARRGAPHHNPPEQAPDLAAL